MFNSIGIKQIKYVKTLELEGAIRFGHDMALHLLRYDRAVQCSSSCVLTAESWTLWAGAWSLVHDDDDDKMMMMIYFSDICFLFRFCIIREYWPKFKPCLIHLQPISTAD